MFAQKVREILITNQGNEPIYLAYNLGNGRIGAMVPREMNLYSWERDETEGDVGEMAGKCAGFWCLRRL